MQRHLDTLEKLLEISVPEAHLALSRASDLVAKALRADKVDMFLYDRTRDSLVALGTSSQPLSMTQKMHGLDVLQLSNGGRVVHVFRTGTTFCTGNLLEDPEELRGVKEALGIQSKLGVPLHFGGQLRGVMMLASQKPNFFTDDDIRFAESVARWISLIAHRAELIEEISRAAVAEGRRAAAEELITILAHDLRNYISPIQLRLTLLRRRAARDWDERYTREIDLALSGIHRLSALIGDLLDVARLEEGVFEIETEPTDVVELIEDLAATLSTEQHAIRVTAPEPLIVAADATRLRQCLENLIANGVKHSPPHAPMEIEILRGRSEREDGEIVMIHVVDHGAGVAPEVLPVIFDRFVTGHRREGGLGLGLYLAKQIAMIHRGDLTVSSAPGKGARFTLTLPLQARSEASPSREAAEASDLG
jgi:two-component system, OmpR family, sensor kinase